MHSTPFSSGWKQLRPAHPKPFSGGSLSAPFQSRFGAIAFISLRRKQQRQGRQLLGCMQLEAVYPAPPLSSRQKTFHVAVLLYYPKVALYFPKLAAIYLGTSFVMLSRQPRYAVALPFRGRGAIYAGAPPAAEAAGQASSGATFHVRSRRQLLQAQLLLCWRLALCSLVNPIRRGRFYFPTREAAASRMAAAWQAAAGDHVSRPFVVTRSRKQSTWQWSFMFRR